MFDLCFTKKKKNVQNNNSSNNNTRIPLKLTHYLEEDTNNHGIRLDSEARWTRGEKQLFWDVIRTHIHNILLETSYGIDQRNLISLIDIYFSKLDPTSWKDFCRCRDLIRENLWKGEYRKAVIHYVFTKEFFYILFGVDLSIEDELKELESIYFNAYYVHNGSVRF